MKAKVSLERERVLLRPIAEEDIAPVARILAHPEIAVWWIGYDEDKTRRDLIDGSGSESFTIELEGSFIGVILYTEENDPDYRYAMIDVTVDADHVGQDLGTDALRTVARFLIEERGHQRPGDSRL